MRASNVLNDEYFNWICDLVEGDISHRESYIKLLSYLHSKEFTYTIEYDGNRADDGIDLRYRFIYFEYPHDEGRLAGYLDDGPCSILEMMVALAIRCEEHIMDDPDEGDRTSRWFWEMIDNLGLGSMSDSRFDSIYVERAISRFLNRDYGEDGSGGLFTVKNYNRDLRTVEIWCQMCWHLDEILGDVGGFDYI